MWTSKHGYEAHMKRFMGYTQEIRTSVVFNLLKEQFYCKTRDGKSALST